MGGRQLRLPFLTDPGLNLFRPEAPAPLPATTRRRDESIGTAREFDVSNPHRSTFSGQEALDPPHTRVVLIGVRRQTVFCWGDDHSNQLQIFLVAEFREWLRKICVRGLEEAAYIVITASAEINRIHKQAQLLVL
jgi:hypothetical protein